MQRNHARAGERRRPRVTTGDFASEKKAGDAGQSAGVAGAAAGLELAGEREGIAGDGHARDQDSQQGLGVLFVNPVELDTAALDAEADRLLAGAAPELTQDPTTAAAPGAGELVNNGLGSWIEVTPGLVAAADVLLLPQWHLRTEEKDQLAGALGSVLDQLFPGGMSDPRWSPYLRLVAVSVAIGVAHRDPETGKFPPLGPLKLAEKTTDAAVNGTSAGDRKAA